ncbi:mediator of DNA damage checkpoint protein 1 isoform X10 [Odocoileus virginianus]|uniref:Mediator of DNA damage checkpoint protein 1 n=1 Tax=Odocoileus virginianus TaxID=9874 RepID=A0ABM4HBI3_ODOVR
MCDSATPWTAARLASLSMGLSRQEYWSWLPFPSPRNLPDPGIEPVPTASPELIMEDTQVLNWEVEEEEEVEESPTESVGYSLEPLGQLHIFSSSYGPEKDFPLYLGKNMIGRMPDCSVALPFSSISKQHAVIEISAWDKAPVLRDCGSLNGTQILRPPKVLGPGVSHRLQDRELILFADLPCQYHRLDVPRPFVSRGPLTVEETPRVPGGTQTSRLLLAEDSEEEADSLLHKCVVKGPRTSLATVVPESDEEGPSPTPDGPGPPASDLNSDTDEEESQESGAGEASSAARRGTAAETEQLEPVTAEVQIEKDQCSVKERNRDTEIKRDVRTGVVPIGVILERSQPSGEGSDTDVSDESGPPRRLAGVRPKRAWSCNFIDSDTDGEDEGIPATPAVVPMKERQTFHEAGTQSPQACGVVHRQESPADGDTDIEEGEAPPDRIQASMVIDSNTDGEEEVSAALTLARLRESQADSEDLDLPATQCFVDRENQSLEGDLNCEMPPAEKASRGDQESPEACLPPAAPEASAPLPNSLISQIQKHPTPQSLLFPSPAPLELPIPRTRQNESQEAPETSFSSELNSVHPEPKVRPQGSSPVSSLPLEPHPTTPTGQPIALEPTSGVSQSRSHSSFDVTASSVIPTALALQPSTSTDQPVTPKPTLRAPRGRAHRSSVKTPEPSVPTDQPVAPELTAKATRGRAQRSSVKTPKPDNPTTPQPQPSTSTDQPVTPKPTSRAPRGRTPRSSAKTPEPVVPTASELQPAAPKDQPVAPELTSRATRGRTQRSSVKTSKPDTSTTPEPQPSTSTDQPVTPKPTSRAPRGRTPKSSAKTPEPVVSTASELQPSALTDQPVTPELPSRATQGRTQRSSVKTPDPVTTTTPELQPSTSTDQLVTPKPTSRAPRGRTRKSSAKTPEPVVPTASELQPSAPADQPVGPLATQCRRHRSSVKTPEPVVPTVPEPHSSTWKDQSVAPEPTPQATQSQTHRSSVKTSQPTEPTAPDLKPSSPTDEPVTPKVIAQGGPSRTRRSSTASAVLVPTTPEFQSPVPSEQPLPPDPIPEVNCSRRPRATRKQGSPIAHVHEPCTTPPEPNSRSSRNQRRGAVKAAKPLSTIPEPAFAQLPEAPPHTPQMPEEEAADGSGFTPEPQPKASQNRKRPSATAHSPPLQKRLQRGKVPEKAASLKEEEENPAARPWKEEGVVSPGPGKRKREQTEEESQGRPSRSLRRTKPIQESTAPKVLFTGVVDARGERTVLALGGSLASSVAEASHLVTDRIRRTVKFLCALGRGIPILSLAWLHESRKAGCFLPPDEYLVTDPEQEKNFGFSLREALSRAQKRRLLEGYEIHVTPGVQPPPPQMGEIINCCGGAILPSMPRSYKPQRVVITCSQDFPRCAIPHRVGLPILSPEFLLTGVLKQEVKPEAFAFSTVEMSST